MSLFLNASYGSVTKYGFRSYSFCCPPRPPTGQCRSTVPEAETETKRTVCCRPCNIPPNPCVPRYHHGKSTWKKYKYLAILLGFPLILFQTFNICGHSTPSKGECRDFEYMRLRTKKFPWGDGIKSLFHNDRVNHLPGECVPPPLDCD